MSDGRIRPELPPGLFGMLAVLRGTSQPLQARSRRKNNDPVR